MPQATHYDADLFDDAAIADPYAHYRAIRDAGAAVRLTRHDLWAVGRFKDVRAVLHDHRTFTSARGVAANETVNRSSLGTTISTDPPAHTAKRDIIRAPLTIPALEAIKPRIAAAADALVERLAARGSFDAVADLARHLPVSIVSDLVGLPEQGRANMLRWAGATFDALGVMNARAEAALPLVDELKAYCGDPATRDNLRPDGWAAAIWRAAQRGAVDVDQCPVMMRDYIGPSLDTTIFATASLVLLLGRHPEQWAALREDPSLVPAAIDEAIRLESPIRAFTRCATRDCAVGDVAVPAGARLLVLYASANRDERKWERPDAFDIRRRARDHLGFGFGPHICAGMHLARIEITAVLNALVRRVERLEVGDPDWASNNMLRGLESLPVTVHAAARTVAEGHAS